MAVQEPCSYSLNPTRRFFLAGLLYMLESLAPIPAKECLCWQAESKQAKNEYVFFHCPFIGLQQNVWPRSELKGCVLSPQNLDQMTVSCWVEAHTFNPGRVRQISVNSRASWSTEWFPAQRGLLKRETLSPKKIKQKNSQCLSVSKSGSHVCPQFLNCNSLQRLWSSQPRIAITGILSSAVTSLTELQVTLWLISVRSEGQQFLWQILN